MITTKRMCKMSGAREFNYAGISDLDIPDNDEDSMNLDWDARSSDLGSIREVLVTTASAPSRRRRGMVDPETGKPSNADNAISRTTFNNSKKVDPVTGKPSNADNAISRTTFNNSKKVDPETGEPSNADNAISYAAFNSRKNRRTKRITPAVPAFDNSSTEATHSAALPINVVNVDVVFGSFLASTASNSTSYPNSHLLNNPLSLDSPVLRDAPSPAPTVNTERTATSSIMDEVLDIHPLHVLNAGQIRARLLATERSTGLSGTEGDSGIRIRIVPDGSVSNPTGQNN